MPEWMDYGFLVIWVVSVAILLYGAYHSLVAMNAYPMTGFRNMVWPPVQDIVPVELPTKYILHRNKARRAVTVFVAFNLLFLVVALARALWQA